MQLLSKKEKEMTKEEKLKLDFMRALVTVQIGVNIRVPDRTYDFTWDSKKSNEVDVLFKKFKIDYVDKEDEKNFLPESLTYAAGTPEFENIVANIPNKDKIRNERLRQTQLTNILIQDLNGSSSETNEALRQKQIKAKKESEKNEAPTEIATEVPTEVNQDEVVQAEVLEESMETLNSIPEVTEETDMAEYGNDLDKQKEEGVVEKDASKEKPTKPKTGEIKKEKPKTKQVSKNKTSKKTTTNK